MKLKDKDIEFTIQEIIDWAKENRGHAITACASGISKEDVAERKGYADALEDLLTYLTKIKP